MSMLSSFREPSPPPVAVELAATRVSAAAVEARGSGAVVSAHGSEPLPEGALVPSLNGSNVRDRAAVVAALERVFSRMGVRPRRIGLVIPDPVSKVSLVKFERVPARRQDLDQLIRWQVKKAAPFPIEESQISYAPALAAADGQEFVVSMARRDIIQEYETVCAGAGAHAGIVDLATFSVVNAVLATTPNPASDPSRASGSTRAPSSDDWLLVNVTTEYASIVILRGEHLIFFRNRASETDGGLSDLVHQAAMYYEDRLSGSGFSRAILAGAAAAAQGAGLPPPEVEDLRRSLESRLNRPVETFDPRTAVSLTDRIVAAPALLDTLTPLVGLVLRGREVTA